MVLVLLLTNAEKGRREGSGMLECVVRVIREGKGFSLLPLVVT